MTQKSVVIFWGIQRIHLDGKALDCRIPTHHPGLSAPTRLASLA